MKICDHCGGTASRVVSVADYGGGIRPFYVCNRCQLPGGTVDDPRPIPAPADAASVALLDRTSAAAYLSVGEDHFDRHVRPNVKVRMVGSKPMFTRAELDRFAASGSEEL